MSSATQLAFSASIAVGPDGGVYIAWDDPGNRGIWISRSGDGVDFGAERLVAAYLPLQEHCEHAGAEIPAQSHRCVGPNPIVTLDTRLGAPMRVEVTYGNLDANDSQSVFLVSFDSTLRHAFLGRPADHVGERITPPEPEGSPADQFWPTAAFDASTRSLWVCFYDTTGDPSRRSASYSCMVSGDRGASWLGPARIATVASDETQPLARHFEYGDYEGLAVSSGVAHPIWTDSRELATAREEIYTARVTEADMRAVSRKATGPK